MVAQAVQGATTWHITTVARRQERSQLSCLRGDVVVTREVLRHQKFHHTGQGDANGHGVGVNSLSPSSIVGSTARHHKQGPARDTGQGLLAHMLAERFVVLLAGARTDSRADGHIETKLSGGRNINSRLLHRRQRLAGDGINELFARNTQCLNTPGDPELPVLMKGVSKGIGAKEDADAGIISQVTALRPAKLDVCFRN